MASSLSWTSSTPVTPSSPPASSITEYSGKSYIHIIDSSPTRLHILNRFIIAYISYTYAFTLLSFLLYIPFPHYFHLFFVVSTTTASGTLMALVRNSVTYNMIFFLQVTTFDSRPYDNLTGPTQIFDSAPFFDSRSY